MSGEDRSRLRETFTEAAELYHRVRPGYPPRLFDDLDDLAGIIDLVKAVAPERTFGIHDAQLNERGLDS